MVGPLGKASQRTAMLAGLFVAGMLAAPHPAKAQFFFWDRPHYSADDVARMTIQHGYRPLVKPFRNEDVYVADVLDQRGRRERLIVSAESGEILQRMYLDTGRGFRRYADPSIPRGPIPPGRIPDETGHNLLSRLVPDDGGADRVAPPPPGDEEEVRPAVRPPRVRRPRIATPAPDTVHVAPVESAPLAPATPPPAPLRNPAPAPAAPAQAALPPASAAPAPTPAAPVDKPGRPIARDPLAIPGSRERDEEQAAAGRARATAPAAPAKATPKAEPAKPAVPVAPLE